MQRLGIRVRGLALVLVAALLLGVPASAGARTRHHHRRHHPVAKAPPATPASPATPTTSVPAVCANADTPVLLAPAATLRTAVQCLVNQQRVAHGLPALADSPLLDTAAQAWTDAMVLSGVFSHGTNFTQRLAAVDYDWSLAGENIASGFETPATVVAAWMASTDHCQNILNPGYAQSGVGVNPSPVADTGTDAATWTQDFGLPMTSSAPSRSTAPMDGCPYA